LAKSQVPLAASCMRLFSLAMLVTLVAGSTGCLHHNTRGGCSKGMCGSGHCSTGGCEMGSCEMGGCETGSCGSGGCSSCEQATSSGILSKVKCKMASRKQCGCASCGSGLLGKVGGLAGIECKGDSCGSGNCGGSCGGGNCGGCGRMGCGTGALGWQQGGLDYSSHLTPGLMGHNAAAQLNSRPFTPGPPTGQTAYPYYTVRGPRDFLMANPPTIGR
jgi:hypothetical protein